MSRGARTSLVAGGVLLGLVIVGWLAISLLFDSYRIPSVAMSPTIHQGDRVAARSVSGDDVSRGDVVIFAAPGRAAAPGPQRITRVVALAGDKVGQDADFLTINGQRADEPYLPTGTRSPGIQPLEVPKGHVFVLGDNRENSQDSRYFGPVPNENVRQLVVLRWWPLRGFGGV